MENTKPAKELQAGDVINLSYVIPEHPTATISQPALITKKTRADDLVILVLRGVNGGRLVDAWESDEEVALGEWK